MSADKLVRMANDIGRFFAHRPPDVAAAAIADHLRKFWDPRMRAQIRQKLNNGDVGLDPNARRAVESLSPD